MQTVDMEGGKKEKGNGYKRGTHNVFAAPVLMLSPAGPLADRVNDILVGCLL